MKNLTFNSHKNHNPSCDILELQINNNSMITFGIYVNDTDKNKKGDKFMEFYSGQNYVVGSTQKSYSRMFAYPNIPKKYIKQWIELKNIYVEKYL